MAVGRAPKSTSIDASFGRSASLLNGARFRFCAPKGLDLWTLAFQQSENGAKLAIRNLATKQVVRGGPDSMPKVSISNPLTLIAIFAGLAETTAVSVLPFLEPNIQSTFVWFVMLFPALLVGLFFAVLWWKSQNLYAPADYRDDSSYLHVHGTQRSSGQLASTNVTDDGARVDETARGGANPGSGSAPAGDTTSTIASEGMSVTQSTYRLSTPAPTPRIAQATLEFGEAVMAERLALEKLRAQRGGVLTSPATITVKGVPYQFDGVLAQGKAINVVEVIYKRERDIAQKVKSQLEVFVKLKRQIESDEVRQEVVFTIAVVSREAENQLNIDSMVRSYAKNLGIEVSVEVYDLKSLMSDLNV